jgi:hypothetical protein
LLKANTTSLWLPHIFQMVIRFDNIAGKQLSMHINHDMLMPLKICCAPHMRIRLRVKPCVFVTVSLGCKCNVPRQTRAACTIHSNCLKRAVWSSSDRQLRSVRHFDTRQLSKVLQFAATDRTMPSFKFKTHCPTAELLCF